MTDDRSPKTRSGEALRRLSFNSKTLIQPHLINMYVYEYAWINVGPQSCVLLPVCNKSADQPMYRGPRGNWRTYSYK